MPSQESTLPILNGRNPSDDVRARTAVEDTTRIRCGMVMATDRYPAISFLQLGGPAILETGP
ncbi:MAG: hypothetical protein A3H93_02230 [Rhodocyclales bacterium RIFCSPLOWO2_02_FULL_63_24]|nr:MAG: hypothetical protein A2040_10880 [Rhodocyclales bacterium GWA2_65_19]OHC73154.1 MAG: hypothetical protein A3H93_02230 [Rhodocyclales bacterium RIFCSPLOWO2_02_FULL_63_24]